MGNILEMRSITKMFPGVKALDNVNLSVKQGEIHALVGENGAGKSTLMNVLCGVHPYGSYTGDIIYNGGECRFKGIKDSESQGIVIIHQELALVPYLSVAENMFLGNEQQKANVINWALTDKKAKEYLHKVNLKEKTSALIVDIGVGKQQLVEIAKALAKDVKLLILDEPTAALNEEDSNNLLNLLLQLKKDGITSILISHKIKEVAKVADSITIIRDGATIETLVAGVDDISEDRIIKGMVGRDLHDYYPKRSPEDGYSIGDVYFEVEDWCVEHPETDGKYIVDHVSLNVKKGEIVGISGLMGAGRTEFAMSLFGKLYGKRVTGKLLKLGKEISTHTVRGAINHGIAYVSEDRKTYGLILIEDVKQNISLVNLKSICSKIGVINKNEEANVAERYRRAFSIKTPSLNQLAGNLSGGNQQKVVLSKWLFAEPELMILDEPTRGIDVGAKYEIYTIINQMAKEGKSVIIISSEMPEILGMCDRIYVMNEGRIVGELDKSQATQESIMKCIMDSAAAQSQTNTLQTEAVT